MCRRQRQHALRFRAEEGGRSQRKILKEIVATTKEASWFLKTLEAGKTPLILAAITQCSGTVRRGRFIVARPEDRVVFGSKTRTPTSILLTLHSGNVARHCRSRPSWDSATGLSNIFNFLQGLAGKLLLVGIRDVDDREKETSQDRVEVLHHADIESAMATGMERRCAPRAAEPPAITSRSTWIGSTGRRARRRTPVQGGATYREAPLAMEIIADHGRMTSSNRRSESCDRRAQRHGDARGRLAVWCWEENPLPFLIMKNCEWGSVWRTAAAT